MEDDKRLQRIILQVVAEERKSEQSNLLEKVRIRCAALRTKSLRTRIPRPTNEDIKHQLKLLTDSKELEETVSNLALPSMSWSSTYYEITAIGHKTLAPLYRKLIVSIKHRLGTIITALLTTHATDILHALMSIKLKLFR